jgi:response regulator RpfG family c-di-GMP phosphodiesterase
MSALPIPFHKDKDAGSTSNGRILKVNNPAYTLDPYHDRLVSMGYEVIEASSYDEGITLAQQHQPELVVVYDDPATGFDALVWLDKQHNDRFGWVATTPLMILADASRSSELRIEELPDRVVILQRRADTLNQLTRMVRRLLNANRWG